MPIPSRLSTGCRLFPNASAARFRLAVSRSASCCKAAKARSTCSIVDRISPSRFPTTSNFSSSCRCKAHSASISSTPCFFSRRYIKSNRSDTAACRSGEYCNRSSSDEASDRMSCNSIMQESRREYNFSTSAWQEDACDKRLRATESNDSAPSSPLPSQQASNAESASLMVPVCSIRRDSSSSSCCSPGCKRAAHNSSYRKRS